MADLAVSFSAVALHSIRGLTTLSFQHCPLFHCRFIALKSRTFVVKSRTTFAIKFVRALNAKVATMGDGGAGNLERSNQEGLILCLIRSKTPLSAIWIQTRPEFRDLSTVSGPSNAFSAI